PPTATGLQAGGAAYPPGPPEQWPAYAPPGPVPPAPGGPRAPSAPLPDGGPGAGRGGAVALTALAVVIVLALFIVGVGALVASTDGAEDAATDTTIDLSDPEITAPPSEEPIDPTMPSIPGFDPFGPGGVDPTERARPLADVLPELIAFVEETRQLQFVTDPVVQAVPDDEFEALLAEGQADEAEETRDDAVASIALGLLPTGFDVVAATEELGAVSVFGFYDPDTAELYVKGDQVTPFVQAVIAHELTHALDDQHFDLSRLDELAEQPDEAAFAYLSLVEGTASYVGDAYKAQLAPEDDAAYQAEEYAIGLDQLPSAIGLPPFLLIGGQVPYASGQLFVEGLVADGGMAAVDAAYDDPPTTSEQILDPAVAAAAEGPVALTPPEAPAGVEVVEEGAFGAVDLRLLEVVSDPLTSLIDPNIGQIDPVPGYGGGRYVSWTDGGQSCISLEAVGDDAAGSATIAAALDSWAGSAPGAEVGSRVGGSGIDVITASRCA
ncbi:MAG TPA: hypothetical protein VK507_11115, partial [Iamia sp.]|nr:hypothetical protein [Iamia sp.]